MTCAFCAIDKYRGWGGGKRIDAAFLKIWVDMQSPAERQLSISFTQIFICM